MSEAVEVMEQGRSAISMYMSDVNKHSVLSVDENIELGKMLKNSETRQDAINRLVEGNLKLVVKQAHDWKGRGLGLDDLIAEGNIGLCMAAEKFDIDCGKNFATYATWWIRSRISRALSNAHTVRIPAASDMKKRQVAKFMTEFYQKNGTEATKEDIKQFFGMSDIEYRNLGKLENVTISMNQKYDDSDSNSDEIGDVIAAEQETKSVLDEIVNKEEVQALLTAIDELDEQSKTVIKMRFGIGFDSVATLDEVAVKIGRTREGVRQIEKRAKVKLKTLVQNKLG